VFNAQTFSLRAFSANTFIGSGALAPATISIPITRAGVPLALLALDYWIINSADEVIASGTATTDADGILSITLSAGYSGESVNVVVNNLGLDMSTAGKVQKQYVVVVP
jgi:hypothetical protein